MTCDHCGMTIGWDCECDPEYNQLIADTLMTLGGGVSSKGSRLLGKPRCENKKHRPEDAGDGTLWCPTCQLPVEYAS